MAQGTLAPTPILLAADTNGAPVNAAKAYWYLAGTSTAATVYTDVNLTVAHATPVVANSAGRFPEIYLSPGVSYKLDMQTSAGVSLSGYPADNIQAVPSASGSTDITGTVGIAIAAGQSVYLSDGSGGQTAGQWFKTDATNTYSSTLPDVGMAPAAIAINTSGTIRISGQVTGLSGLVAGTSYYLSSTPGAVTSTAPSNSRFIGVADTTSSMVITPNPSTSTPGSGGLDILQIRVFL